VWNSRVTFDSFLNFGSLRICFGFADDTWRFFVVPCGSLICQVCLEFLDLTWSGIWWDIVGSLWEHADVKILQILVGFFRQRLKDSLIFFRCSGFFFLAFSWHFLSFVLSVEFQGILHDVFLCIWRCFLGFFGDACAFICRKCATGNTVRECGRPYLYLDTLFHLLLLLFVFLSLFSLLFLSPSFSLPVSPSFSFVSHFFLLLFIHSFLLSAFHSCRPG